MLLEVISGSGKRDALLALLEGFFPERNQFHVDFQSTQLAARLVAKLAQMSFLTSRTSFTSLQTPGCKFSGSWATHMYLNLALAHQYSKKDNSDG